MTGRSRCHFEHDNCDRGDARQVIMDRRNNRKKFQGKQGGFKGARYDGDVNMGSSDRPSNSRFKPYNGHGSYVKQKLKQYGGRSISKRSFCDEQAIRLLKATIATHSSKRLPPVTVIDSITVEKIKACMEKRYNSSLNQLNLSSFCSDPDLAQEGLYISLHRPDAMNSVVNIIKENIPQIQQLDLSENRLTNLNGLSPLVTNCRELKSLVLKNNKLKSIAVLNALKGMDLLELVLDGNALCENFKDRSTYISTVREKFPRIIKLDQQKLPAPILFSLGAPEVLPASKGSSFPEEGVKILATQFLEEYYSIFDSSNRQPLIDAYHDQAVFSFSAAKIYYKGWSLQAYIRDSRNLLKIGNSLKHKLLRQGRLSVVSSLSEMPQTRHDPTSFTVDVSPVSPRLMCITVTGVFKEVVSDIKDAPLRTFHRTFMLVPQEQGVSIINDIMQITNATSGQIKAFKMVTPTPTSPAPIWRTAKEQQQMTIEFSKWTRMNIEFSAKCLEECEWNEKKAAHIFQTLNAKGMIPVEAFTVYQMQTA